MHASADYRGQLGFHRDSKFSNFPMLFTANSLSHPHVSNVNNPELGKDFESDSPTERCTHNVGSMPVTS